jgi:hypothetical protein
MLLPQATVGLIICQHSLGDFGLVKYDCRGEIKTKEIFQMKGSAKKITCGDFKALRKITALTHIKGEWVKNKGSEDHYQYRTDDGAVLNYWRKTGTVFFQGPEFAADELKAAFLKRAVVIKQH